MFDSRSDHPIGGVHFLRSYRDLGEGQRADYGTPPSTIEGFRSTAKAQIAEGLAELAAPIDLDEFWLEPGYHYEPEVEPMAEWEITLLTPAGTEVAADAVWTTSTRWAEPIDLDWVEDLEIEDEDDTDWTPWLTGTVAEAFPDRCYVVEGPTPKAESVRAEGYYRVYEAARILDVDTRVLVRLLRAEGEWVTGAGSYVAKPVIDEWVESPAMNLYRPRKERLADNLAALRTVLSASIR